MSLVCRWRGLRRGEEPGRGEGEGLLRSANGEVRGGARAGKQARALRAPISVALSEYRWRYERAVAWSGEDRADGRTKDADTSLSCFVRVQMALRAAQCARDGCAPLRYAVKRAHGRTSDAGVLS